VTLTGSEVTKQQSHDLYESLYLKSIELDDVYKHKESHVKKNGHRTSSP